MNTNMNAMNAVNAATKFDLSNPATFEANGFAANGMASFREYASQLAIPEIAGTRIVKCLYKENQKTKEKAGVNSYVRIPECFSEMEIQKPEVLAKLAPYFLDYLEEKQDTMIKDWHKKGVSSFLITGLNVDQLVSWLEENQGAGRLNSEKIAAWFAEVLEQKLIAAFAKKLDLDLVALTSNNEMEVSAETAEKLAKLEKIVEAYRDKFCSLASPKIVFKEADCLALQTILTKFELADSISLRFMERLEKMKTKVDDVLLAL